MQILARAASVMPSTSKKTASAKSVHHLKNRTQTKQHANAQRLQIVKHTTTALVRAILARTDTHGMLQQNNVKSHKPAANRVIRLAQTAPTVGAVLRKTLAVQKKANVAWAAIAV